VTSYGRPMITADTVAHGEVWGVSSLIITGRMYSYQKREERCVAYEHVGVAYR